MLFRDTHDMLAKNITVNCLVKHLRSSNTGAKCSLFTASLATAAPAHYEHQLARRLNEA